MSTTEDQGFQEWLHGSDRYATPEQGSEPTRPYDERGTEIAAFLFAVLMGAAIIGLFMFITWLTYAAD